jgi:hypothetical protein
MSDEGKKSVNFDKGIEHRNTSDGAAKVVAEVLGKNSHDKADVEYSRSVSLLGKLAELINLRTEEARAKAAELSKRQSELTQLVGTVRDLAKDAAALIRENQFLSMAVDDNPRPAAAAVILLARILRNVYSLSYVTKTTVESQSATMRRLTETVADAAQVSTTLTGKVAALAEETRTVLPLSCQKNLVEAGLQWLTTELHKTVTDFQQSAGGVQATAHDDTLSGVAQPHLVN